jgi:hypothetical protein
VRRADEFRIAGPVPAAKDPTTQPLVGRAVGRGARVTVVLSFHQSSTHSPQHCRAPSRDSTGSAGRNPPASLPMGCALRPTAVNYPRIIVCLATRDRPARPEWSRYSCARHIFTFSLAEEPIGLSGLARKPFGIGFGVAPIDVDHRPPTATPAAIVGSVRASCLGPLMAEASQQARRRKKSR